MSWRDGRDSCTCSCTLTGLPAQIPTELRRGSANKTQTVILEVPTCLTPHILTSSPRPTNSNNNYNYYYLLLLLLLLTTYYILPTQLQKFIKIYSPSPFSTAPHPLIITLYYYIIIIYILIATLHYVACFPPVLGFWVDIYIYIIYNTYSTYMYIYIRLYINYNYYYIIYMHTHIYLHIYIYMYM